MNSTDHEDLQATKLNKRFNIYYLTLAVLSQGMQDHLGAKSANWLAGCVVNLVSNFMKSKLPGEIRGENCKRGCTFWISHCKAMESGEVVDRCLF